MKFLLFLLLLISCHDYHGGYNFEDTEVCVGDIGKTTKDDILAMLGPETITIVDDNKLLYVSRKDYNFLFVRHILTKQKSCIFTFDHNNLLISVIEK